MINVQPEGKNSRPHLLHTQRRVQCSPSPTDWNMFRDSSSGIEEYTTSVTGFINKCIDDVVPIVTVRAYPTQKPWITDNIHTELKAIALTFKERDSDPEAYKKSRCAL